MIFIVIGMHKSGTTLVAQSLHLSDVNMGFDLEEGDHDYQSEKCESKLLRQINKALLSCGNTLSIDIKTPKNLNITAEIDEQKDLLLNRQAAYANWGLKDPRVTLTYRKYWSKILPEHKIIFVYRSPLDVLNYYARHYSGSKQRKSVIVWMKYNMELINILKERDPDSYLLINYNRFMSGDTELERMRQFTGVNLVDARAQKQKRVAERPLRKKLFCFLSGSYGLYLTLELLRLQNIKSLKLDNNQH